MTTCKTCGMPVQDGEYHHPYAACLMFQACQDAETVRANLDAAVAHGVQEEREREHSSEAYASLAIEGIRATTLFDGIETLRGRLMAVDIYERGFGRYEAVRKLNAQQFAELFRHNIETGRPFDDLVDELVALAPAVRPAEPSFDRNGDPSNETLDTIRNWTPDWSRSDDGQHWAALAAFVRESWDDTYGIVREAAGGVLEFVTGGWSGNECIIGAMKQNTLFMAVCWESSHRGGLHCFRLR